MKTINVNAKHISILKNLKLSQVTRVYSGRPGCACGCKGSYSDAPKAQLKFNNMRKFAEDRIWSEGDHTMMGDSIDEGEQFISIQTEDKVYTVYFRAA